MTDQKSIFISGGASGIGRAIAQRFAREGWLVGLGDLDSAGMAETLALLPESAGSAHRLDVTQPSQWSEALAQFAERTGGGISVLANNAGIPSGGPLEELSLEEIDRVIAVNLSGVFYGAHAALPFLRKAAPGACLLNTASAAALYGMANQSVYGATKAGVRSLTECLDAEWAAHGISARSLMPSFIDTPLLAHAPNRSRNTPIRDAVMAAGLEFTPVETVADAAWDAVHGKRVHTVVGKTARKMRRVAKWMPSLLARRAKLLRDGAEG